MEDIGWAWFTTSYTDIPQIQRDDITRSLWSDAEAAVHVLQDYAMRGRYIFEYALRTHILSSIAHTLGRAASEPNGIEKMLEEVEDEYRELKAIPTYNLASPFKLPYSPPC